MSQLLLRQKLRELCNSTSTLLWLEGAKHAQVLSVSLQSDRLVLNLDNGTTRVVAFQKFAVTSVGLQFWSAGRPGVLYKWDQVPKQAKPLSTAAVPGGVPLPFSNNETGGGGDDDGHEPPPGMAA